MQGQLDTDLSDLGRDQAGAAAEVLAKRQPLLIVSSDLRRALDTAVTLGERSGLPVLDRHPPAGDAPRRLAGSDTSRGGRSWRRGAAGVAKRRAMGAARRGEPGRRGGTLPAVGRGAGYRSDRVGDRRTRAAGCAGGARRAHRRADSGAAELPVDNWPALGGMGNASWVQLSGHSEDDAGFDDIRWRLDVWNASAQVANDVL